MYSHDLKIYSGVNNLVNFVFLNNDQKAVNIANLSVQFNIFDVGTQHLLLSKSANIANASLGYANVTISSNDLLGFEEGFYEIAVTVIDDGNNIRAAYVDDNFQNRLTMTLEPGPVAALTEPTPIQFLSSQNISVISNPIDLTSYSSAVNNFTFKANLNQYTGNLFVQGSLTYSPNFNNTGNSFANISILNYSNYTGPVISTISNSSFKDNYSFGNAITISFTGNSAQSFVNAVNFAFIPNLTANILNNVIVLTNSVGLPFLLSDGNNTPLLNAGIIPGVYGNSNRWSVAVQGENINPDFTSPSDFTIAITNPISFNGSFTYLRFLLDGSGNNSVISNSAIRII